MRFVYAFDHPHEVEPRSQTMLLGFEGANLAEMRSVLGLPVPPGFTITTEACRWFLADGWPDGLDDELATHLLALEAAMGRRLGDADDPLLVSVRPSAASSTPGTIDTISQLRAAVEAVFASGNAVTAVNVQAMVFGDRDDNSGSGVGFTRDPSTGAPDPVVHILMRENDDLQGLRRRFPEVHAQLLDVFARLEDHHRDLCEITFTIERGTLFVLQARVAERAPLAALRLAVAMTEAQGSDGRLWRITRDEAVLRVTAGDLDGVLHPQFDEARGVVLTTGLGASPGAAVGQVYFSADAAADAADRGEQTILVRGETSPEDVHGMAAAEGILTARGGLVSHAAVVARGWGKPAVVGAEAIVVGDSSFSVTGADGAVVVVREGDVISIDGSSGQVVLGQTSVSTTGPPPEFATLLSWADEVRGTRFGVRANADTGADAVVARQFGAEGIGLCRTEHMFLADDRLPVVRRMILAATPEDEARALEELRVVQRQDFVAILEAMDGLPVTVRLLDPPLHEFLPNVDELAAGEASGALSAEEVALLSAARAWSETNPMLGTRGVRLAVLKPGLYAMQVRALVEAAIERQRSGGNPIVEVMIPLTVTAAEMELARSWVLDAIAQAEADEAFKISVGTMIETPRAALCAGDMATHADFFSFGTNDLTQMTFGFSRDDVEGRLMAAYLDQNLLARNPFESIDVDGVGALVRLAATAGRVARPDLKLGVCGEHGGDPDSIAFFLDAGLDYVSCSPYRVPVARLSVAQAILRSRVA